MPRRCTPKARPRWSGWTSRKGGQPRFRRRSGRSSRVRAMPKEKPVWEPSPERIEHANLTRFARMAVHDWGLKGNTYPAFYGWTVAHPDRFWQSMWKFGGVRAAEQGSRVLVDGNKMP